MPLLSLCPSLIHLCVSKKWRGLLYIAKNMSSEERSPHVGFYQLFVIFINVNTSHAAGEWSLQ